MTPAEQAIAEALWRNIDDDFSAERAHSAFIEHCRACGDLAFAAQRYRRRKEAAAEQESEAIERHLKAITAIAMTQLADSPQDQPPPGEGLRRVVTIVGVLLFIAALGVLAAALRL